jgi:hypothetical protein
MHRNLSQEATLWYTLTSPDFFERAKLPLQTAIDLFAHAMQSEPAAAHYVPMPFLGNELNELLQVHSHAKSMLQHGDWAAVIAWQGHLEQLPRSFDERSLAWMGSRANPFMQALDVANSVAYSMWRAVAMSQRFSSSDYKNGSKDWRVSQPKDIGIDGDGIARYYEEVIFPALPDQIPEYKPDTSVSCETGQLVPWTGVWVPNTGMGSAALAFARKGVQIMQPAYEVASVDEDGFAESFNLVDCIWHPVKPTGSMIEHPLWAQLRANEGRSGGRCESGNRCPREGTWLTPAAPDKRHFKLGEVMPSVGGDYGLTIWQWAGE